MNVALNVPMESGDQMEVMDVANGADEDGSVEVVALGEEVMQQLRRADTPGGFSDLRDDEAVEDEAAVVADAADDETVTADAADDEAVTADATADDGNDGKDQCSKKDRRRVTFGAGTNFANKDTRSKMRKLNDRKLMKNKEATVDADDTVEQRMGDAVEPVACAGEPVVCAVGVATGGNRLFVIEVTSSDGNMEEVIDSDDIMDKKDEGDNFEQLLATEEERTGAERRIELQELEWRAGNMEQQPPKRDVKFR